MAKYTWSPIIILDNLEKRKANCRVYEIFALVGFLLRRLILCYRRLPVPSFKVKQSIAAWRLKMGPIVCTETSFKNYQYALFKNPAGRRSDLHCGGNLKSCAWFMLHWTTEHQYIMESHTVLVYCSTFQPVVRSANKTEKHNQTIACNLSDSKTITRSPKR